MSKQINVMTYNIDWFRNGKRSGTPEKYLLEDCSRSIYRSIRDFVKKFLQRENAVVFLNEVPCMIKDNNKEWKEHPYFMDLLKDFPKAEYDVRFSKNRYVLRNTISISKKDVFCKTEYYNITNDNCITAVKFSDITLVGVHMPQFNKEDANKENAKCAEKRWDALIDFAADMKDKGKKLIILGDFNAYVGCKIKSTDKKYRELLKYATDFVPQEEITYGSKLIDHVLINYDINPNVSVAKEFTYSDHKYVILNVSV